MVTMQSGLRQKNPYDEQVPNIKVLTKNRGVCMNPQITQMGADGLQNRVQQTKQKRLSIICVNQRNLRIMNWVDKSYTMRWAVTNIANRSTDQNYFGQLCQNLNLCKKAQLFLSHRFHTVFSGLFHEFDKINPWMAATPRQDSWKKWISNQNWQHCPHLNIRWLRSGFWKNDKSMTMWGRLPLAWRYVFR